MDSEGLKNGPLSKTAMVISHSSVRQQSISYCWSKKSCTTWDVWNYVNNGIAYLVQDFFHRQYVTISIYLQTQLIHAPPRLLAPQDRHHPWRSQPSPREIKVAKTHATFYTIPKGVGYIIFNLHWRWHTVTQEKKTCCWCFINQTSGQSDFSNFLVWSHRQEGMLRESGSLRQHRLASTHLLVIYDSSSSSSTLAPLLFLLASAFHANAM